MAGDSGTPLLKKLGIKAETVIVAVNPPAEYKKLLGSMPEGVCQKKELRGKFDFIHFFTKSEDELREKFPRLKNSLKESGILWVSWPKGSSKVATDLNDNRVREIGLEAGLVDVKVCAVNDIWSGLKFVYRLKDRGGKST